MKDIYEEIRVVQKGVLEVNEPFNDQKASTSGIMQWPKLLCLCARCAVCGSA